jgi:hypothetical protein
MLTSEFSVEEIKFMQLICVSQDGEDLESCMGLKASMLSDSRREMATVSFSWFRAIQFVFDEY